MVDVSCPSIDRARPLLRHGPRPGASLISIIVPVYNEQEMVGLFLKTIDRVVTGEKERFEIIFVNDGSKDHTLERLREHGARDNRIRIINFTRNFGKEAAITAGLDYAYGDAIIPMDVDLQDPPELIHTFIEKWREGYDIVYGIRESRATDKLIKKTTSGWFYQAFNSISNIPIPENVGDYRLLDRRVVQALQQLPERNRFMKGLFAWVGFNSVGIPYERQARAEGDTKWNYWKLWNFALDGILSFSSAPLRIWTYIGLVVAGLAFLYGLLIMIRVLLTGVDVPGYASLLTVILFLGGVQLISIGILGEYIGRLFIEVKARPIYLVESVIESLSQNTH